MKRTFTNLISALALLVFMTPSMVGWGQTRTEVTDVMNQGWTGVTSTSYREVTGLEGSESDAVYTVQCAGGNSSIQLKSKDNISGIVSTASGGSVTKVTVTWNSNTQNGRVLNVYGKNSAYSAASDLYDNNAGTLIGTIVYGTSTELTITDSYAFIGMRSASGAMYLTEIDVTWSTGGSSGPTTYTVTYDANGGTGTMVDGNSPYEAGVEVTLLTNTFTAPEGKIWDSWEVKDADDNDITVSNGKFTMPANNVTVKAQWVDDPATPQINWVLTNLADLTTDDVFVIVGNNGSNYAMKNTDASNSGPAAIAVTVSGDELSGTIPDNIKWNISGNATDGYIFYPNGSTTTWLYCTNNNNGLRIGSGNTDYNTFEIKDSYIYNTGRGRYVGIYNSTDWRSYTSSGGNIANQTFAFYKKVTGGVVPPSITANNVEIAYDATSGEIAYTLNNPVADGNLSVSENVDWISNPVLNTSENKVTFTTTANEATTPREGIITITYTYGDNETVSKDVTVTQAAAPLIYTTIPDLFAAATGTETSVLVTFNNWVVSDVSTNGKNIFVTDNNGNGFVIYYTTDMSSTFAAGNILSGTAVSCTLKKYNGFAELLNVNVDDLTITEGGTVSVANIEMANLAGVNTGALVHYDNLTCTIDNNKYYLTDGTTTLQVYNALYAFDALTAGKTYNITGVYQQFNNTKEILPRSADDIEEVVSADPSVTVTPNMINAPFTGVDGTLAITYENIPDLISFDIQFCDANGDELTGSDPEWIDAEIQEENDVYSVYYVVDANDGDARTAYFKVYTFVGNNLEEVYAIVTVSQAKYVVDYATLPFEFDGGKAAIENTNGLTQSGLGSDYNSSPKLKFDGTNDCVVLKINERPGTLTFDLKGNGFSDGSTFKVQTSENGETYTDLETYTELVSTGTGQPEEFTNLGENVRYIKWIYTEKVSGNVALGNITLAKYVEPVLVASITVDPALVEVNAEEHDGTLDLTYENLTITEMGDFDIQYYDAEGEETEEPSWIEVTVAEQDPAVGEGYVVSYFMLENEGEARAAYFKVFAVGGEDFVYSNLVTVTQAAPVVDYAMLPFEFDGGRADVANTNGLTQEGLDSDYASSPRLKFNNTGDWLILKLNSAPAAITFDIQGNSFSDGTFTVQTSNDGTTYTNLGEYTELGATQTVTLINTNDAVRFVKWVYTEKVSGNVGLGKIIVTKAMPIAGNTTLTPSTFDPEGNHSYIVGDGATLTLDGDFSNILNEPNYLIIEDGGQVIVNNSGVQATVMKSVAHNTSKDADNWYTISSPVNNPAFANVTNLIQEPAANYDLYRYNETSMIWENKKAHTTDFTSLENGRGYLYWNSTGAELSFAGELNAADVTYHLTYGAEKDNLKGFNLIGNPFSHNIYKGNGAAICDSRLTSGFYVLNNASGWSANPEAYTTAITPGQGILVQTTAAFDLTITNTNAVATTAKSESNDLISFTVANDKYEDVAFVQFKDAIGLNKIEHFNAEIPMLYIFDEGSEFAIANLDRNTKGFDLNFEAATDGEYTVSAKAMGDFEYFHLIDRLAGNDIDMLSEGKYTFTAKKDDIKFRFYVKLSEKSNNSNAENGNFAFISNGQIILNGVSNDATIQVIDMLGRVVSSQTVNGNSAHMAPTASGVYVLRLIDGTNVMTQKIVVK